MPMFTPHFHYLPLVFYLWYIYFTFLLHFFSIIFSFLFFFPFFLVSALFSKWFQLISLSSPGVGGCKVTKATISTLFFLSQSTREWTRPNPESTWAIVQLEDSRVLYGQVRNCQLDHLWNTPMIRSAAGEDRRGMNYILILMHCCYCLVCHQHVTQITCLQSGLTRLHEVTTI
jgi:hypothetical protein